MAKSMVERYEQLLRQDPTSSVFVELAKALLEKGDAARTIEVCTQGITHHPTSTVGRVLWGKALIQLGRPAEAMEQFDQAIAIEKDNPYAYNLIGEVLLQRGLFRSALPILRKAVALQPNNGRVKQWLDQAQQALSGGPAPIFADLGTLAVPAAAPEDDEAPAPGAEAQPSAFDARAAAAAGLEPRRARTETPAGGAERAASEAGPASGAAPTAGATDARASVGPASGGPEGAGAESPGEPSSGREASDGSSDPASAHEASDPADGREASDPADGREASDGSSDPADGREAQGGPVEAGQESSESRREAQAGAEPQNSGAQAGPSEPAKAPGRARSSGMLADLPDAPADEPSSSQGGGLLGNLPGPEAVRARAPAPVAPVATTAGGKRSLLDDIPDATELAAATARNKAAANAKDTEALAAKYEREMHEKIAKERAKQSLLERYGAKTVALFVAIIFLGASAGFFLLYRSRQGGQTLSETLELARRAVAQDTGASLDEALRQLDRARDMDEASAQGWALTAYAHALRYQDHGGASEDRRLALEALEKPGVKDGFAGLVLATNELVADERGRESTRRALLASQDDVTEVHALAGSLLLAAKDEKKALDRFDRALKASPGNVRALVSLGGYYLASEDFAQALEMFKRAREVSKEHPAARIGMAESRLALEQELEAGLADVAPLAKDPKLPPALKPRQQLVHGELLSALGKYEEARALLAQGTQGPLAMDFQLALGAAGRAAGKLEAAQQAYEAALKLQPKSEDAKEGLGRTLLDRDREREALQRLEVDGGRKVAMVRGAAYARLGDWKKARAELARTRVNDRYPPEAVAVLALADANEGNGAQAREVLEKALAKRPRTDLRVALGQVYWRERALDKAQAQFDEALKDPRDYEGACSLGRLLLARGLPDMALKPLTQAVERNGAHGESRDALGRVLLALGRTPEALKQFEAWQLDNPGSAAAQKGFALALYQSGRRKEAEGASGRAVKLAPEDAEGQRLRAALLFSNGDAKGGFAALERANKLDSKDPNTFCEIAQAFLRQGQVESADAAFAAARREGPDATCGRVGELYAQLPGGGRGASRTLQDLADRAHTVWDKAFAQTTLARVLLGAGMVKEARAAADEAVKLAPFSGRAYLALGLVAFKQRQEAPAREALAKAVELEPTDGMAHLALADVLARETAELPRAVESYEAFLRLAGEAPDAKRVKKALPLLKRRASR
ncbi:tetratricopeptide repeat protein [Corallococcus praedator]|uniref:Tetratricopeptide repeat protein n=1 Tax=Corallococcus praedator TaxID=2316724 RepID=A0ABX9Q6T5_9BACT|nr:MULTISPECIES: tetratricopeptide repeat protein [Corallococcus]RKH24250.1 tetratricopeptide repeat protein [Corallococcus sp. CA031C]RKH92734.1 tetratricopeptide repeat protein [Corallococcus praedator]